MIDHEIENLVRRIAPADFASRPIYIVLATSTPIDLRPSAASWGFTASGLDVALSAWLTSCGRWRGRGACVVLNDDAIRADVDQWDDGTDLAGELYRSRILSIALHEFSHVLQSPIDLRPIPDDIATQLEASVRSTVSSWAEGEPIVQPSPWQGHGAGFIRVLLHVVARFERLNGERLPARLLFDHHRYELSPLWAYRDALATEIDAFDSSLTFADLRLCRPPDAFVELWRSDLHSWLSEQESENAVLEVLAAMRPFRKEQ